MSVIETGAASGVLPAGGVQEVPMSCIGKTNFTLSLTSAAAGRKVELTTNGVHWFSPDIDPQSDATEIIVTISSPVLRARFTGAANDTWRVM